MKYHRWSDYENLFAPNGPIFFAFVCRVCGATDVPRKDPMDSHGITKEIRRIKSRTDCDEMFAKRAAARMLK